MNIHLRPVTCIGNPTRMHRFSIIPCPMIYCDNNLLIKRTLIIYYEDEEAICSNGFWWILHLSAGAYSSVLTIVPWLSKANNHSKERSMKFNDPCSLQMLKGNEGKQCTCPDFSHLMFINLSFSAQCM